MEQAKLRICDAFARHDLHIHLNAFSGIGHLLVRLWFVRLFRLFSQKQRHFAHHAEQALRTARITPLPQAVSELDHTKRWIPAAHVTDELQLGFCMLIGWLCGRLD